MNKPTFDAMLAQYKKPTIEGVDTVSWDKGARCVIPGVVMGGKVEQKQCTGKNLFDITRLTIQAESTTDAWISSVTDNHIIISEPSGYALNGLCATGKKLRELSPNLRAGTVCTLSFETESVQGTIYLEGGEHRLWYKGTWIEVTDADLESKVAFYGRSVLHNQPAGDCKISNIQIELGSTATSYEQYTGGIPAPSPNYPIMPTFSEGTKVVSRGKNLWNMLALRQSPNYYILEVGKDHCVLAGPESGNGFVNTALTLAQLAPGLVVGRTYTLQFNTESTNTWIYLQQGWNRSWLSGESYKVTEEMLRSVVVLYGYNISAGQESGNCRISNVQIEEGTVATPYESYFDGGEAVAPELLAIPGTEYRDEWDAQTGKGVRRVGKQVFHESDGWGLSGYSTKSYNAFYSNVRMPGVEVSVFNSSCTSSHFLQKKPTPYVDDGGVVAGINNPYVYFFVPKEVFPDVESFKTFLANQREAGNPVTVWYALPEPIPFQTEPQPLVQPKGYGQLIQTDGTLDNCPITVTPVTHQ